MDKISRHPIIEIQKSEQHSFLFNGKTVVGDKGFTIAAALHQAGYPIHSHSLKHRERSLQCGIGKCGACEMLVDGQIKRICITPVDGIKEVAELPRDYIPAAVQFYDNPIKIYKTTVAIIGAGPAGLAARDILNNHNINNIVIDNNSKIGGQFLMQTHQFFFFEKEKKYGGMRGFDIAKNLAGNNTEGIFLNSTVWDIFDNKRLAVKNINTSEIYFIDAEILIVATGAIPFMPVFENDDLPGVYTAAVIQKMMNLELTLLGKNILTVGAGNIGYLTSYQLMQAGAKVKAIIEAQPFEGGFNVQANRIRRSGIPILTSCMLLKAIPDEKHQKVTGAIIAKCENFNPIKGTEKILTGIDAINICTGLVPDDQLIIKGNEVFGRHCYSAGDATKIGEGTSAVLKGKQVAYEVLQELNKKINYDEFLSISKEYIDSQQHPIKIKDNVYEPSDQRATEKPYVIIDCLYGFACNPCEFACPNKAITKTSTNTIPVIDFEKCTGCLECIYQCPGLAIFGYNEKNSKVFLPVEYEVNENSEVFLVDNFSNILDDGVVEKILFKPNKTNVVRIKANNIKSKELRKVRGFIIKDAYPTPLNFIDTHYDDKAEKFICHCDDVTYDDILTKIGNRKLISIDEVKHITRLGMGICRGKRCISRLKNILIAEGISITGDPVPRAPLANQIAIGDVFPSENKKNIYIYGVNNNIKKKKVDFLISGGGIGGSALFRYFSEAGVKPILINYGHGSSWRNIAGGRPAFSVPEIADIARHNLEIFRELQNIANIDFRQTRYVNFAHNAEMNAALEESTKWSDAYLVTPDKFQNEISNYINPDLSKNYISALITRECWQATPGKVIDIIRHIGICKGGKILEDCELVEVHRDNNIYEAVVKTHNNKFIEYEAFHFINALGSEGEKFARQMGFETGLYPVKHQAFITRRLPMLGINGLPLDMLIDRRNYKGFSAVYGQQLGDTGQVIGCASPFNEYHEAAKNIKTNSKEFLEIISEVFVTWLPILSSVGFQAVWAGYYTEPRMIIDPDAGLFLGLRGQGFMLGQYLAKLYVDKVSGKNTPEYLTRLSLNGDGLPENAFK